MNRPALVVALTLGLAALSGCTATSSPEPEPSMTTTRRSVPTTPSPTSVGPVAVGPARSAASAIRDANASLLGYYTATFRSGHAGGTQIAVVAPWTTGEALQNERALATYLQQKHYRIDGAPTVWTLNPSRSSTARSRGSNGLASLRYGAVKLVGCIESTNRPVGAGAPAWTTQGKRTSIDWTVLYSRAKRQWLVASSTSPSTVLEAGSCG